eukprot:gene659-814_t
MSKLLTVLSLLAILVISTTTAYNTKLEDFVEQPDDGSSYYVHKVLNGQGYKAYVLNFTSINWLTPEESSNPRWWHWLTICIPDLVWSNYGYLYVDNGKYTTNPYEPVYPLIDTLCKSSHSVVSHLLQNPNQPLVLDKDNVSRTEDTIIAYTWKKFIQNRTRSDWIGQFAETKATVRAMDTIQQFVKAKTIFNRVKYFVVSGASKRGWAAWLTAAVDSRVKAVIPVVIPVLSLVENSNAHYKAYGGWSFTYDDYYDEGLLTYLNAEPFDAIAKEIDPLMFVDQLLVPKYVINAVGDQYFIPDSANFFWHKLLGTKHLRIHPNADHYMNTRWTQFISETNTYYNMIINKQKLPEFDWSIVPDASTNTSTIYVNTKTSCGNSNPTSVVVYTADTVSTTQRDWRFSTCRSASCLQNITWVATPLQEADEGFYKYTVTPPARGGWRGAFIELTYNSFYGKQVYTSDFTYAPFSFPFTGCGNDCQNKPYPV